MSPVHATVPASQSLTLKTAQTVSNHLTTDSLAWNSSALDKLFGPAFRNWVIALSRRQQALSSGLEKLSLGVVDQRNV